jgi:hypothetical protein
VPPGKVVDRRVREVQASRNRVVTARCPAGETLSSASHAIGFYGAAPPTAARAAGIKVTQRVRNGIVALVIRSHVPAVVQVNLLCAPR